MVCKGYILRAIDWSEIQEKELLLSNFPDLKNGQQQLIYLWVQGRGGLGVSGISKNSIFLTFTMKVNNKNLNILYLKCYQNKGILGYLSMLLLAHQPSPQPTLRISPNNNTKQRNPGKVQRQVISQWKS